MDRSFPETFEQRAIELASNLGKEHLFVANCPSDIDADKYSGTVITYEEAFDHCDSGVGLCLLLPKAIALRNFVDHSIEKNLSLHFIFSCPSSTSEFEAVAWLYNLLQDRIQHIGFMQNLGINFCSKSNQEKYLIACQVEPNAEHCQVSWPQSLKTLEYVFPRTVVERCDTVRELQALPVVNLIDFRRPNGCHRIADKIDVTSLTVQLADCNLASIEHVEKSIQPTIEAAWAHGLAECQVKHFFPWNDESFQELFPHGITMSVLDLKSFSDVVLREVLVQLASLKIRYHFMNYKRLAIFGPASLVIDLHLALLPVDVHLPIGPKQGAFTIHMTQFDPHNAHPTNDENHFKVKFGKIGSFQYAPAQVVWNEVHPTICAEDQLAHSPLVKSLRQKFGAVNFSIRWCQVDASQQKCLCFDIDTKYENELPFSLDCDSYQVTIQHQCPLAETFRAEIPITEIETRRDHWNKVIAQQMIPKEGRVSHISFDQDKKQAARRYYDLRTTIIDSMRDYTNIITIASQPPAWFFSPKELTQTLRTCLHEINFCDNSFIQQSFMINSDITEIKLRHHDFLKHRDHQKWLFYYITLSPEQCFRFKSIHYEREEWKVRHYDELVIRTFERASMFITLPPGVSISQVIDNHDCCHLQEAYNSFGSSMRSPHTSTAPTGLRGQYINVTPSKNFVNGNGMNQSSRTATRAQPGFSPPSSGPVYCPPTRPRQARGGAREPPESDIEMLPAQVSDAPNLNHGNNSQRQDTQAQTDDVHMECCPTALDSQPHATPETTQEATQTPQAMKGNDNGSDSTVAHQAPTGVMADPNNLPSNSDVANAGYPRLVTECSMDNLVEAAQVGDTVPVSQHQVTSTNNPAATVNVGYPRLASGTHFVEASEQHIPAPKTNNPPSSARATNAKSTKTPPDQSQPQQQP